MLVATQLNALLVIRARIINLRVNEQLEAIFILANGAINLEYLFLYKANFKQQSK